MGGKPRWSESRSWFAKSLCALCRETFDGIHCGVRATTAQNSGNFDRVRETVDDGAALEPDEIQELRKRNLRFTREQFDALSESLSIAFPDGTATYEAFVDYVQGFLDAPLQLGYYVDRAVIKYRRVKGIGGQEAMDTKVLMAILSMALNTDTMEDRVYALVTTETGEVVPWDDEFDVEVQRESALGIIENLLSTDQIPANKLVAPTETKYPFQEYRRATADDLLLSALKDAKLAEKDATVVEATAFRAEVLCDLLLSDAICAWGSCAGNRSSQE